MQGMMKNDEDKTEEAVEGVGVGVGNMTIG